MLFKRAGKYLTMITQAKGGSVSRMTNSKYQILLLAVACLLFQPCAVFSQAPSSGTAPAALTMQQAVDIARMKNPALLSAQQNLLSVKAQEIQAGLRANPSFDVSGSNVTLGAQYHVCSNEVKSAAGALTAPAPPQLRPTPSITPKSNRPSLLFARPLPAS